MSSLHSSVLIVGGESHRFGDFGADVVADLSEAESRPAEPTLSVIVFSAKDKKVTSFLRHLNQHHPNCQRVVIADGSTPQQLCEVVNAGGAFRILSSFADEGLEHTIHEALEQFNLSQQNVDLLSLVNAQNERLKGLSRELEERVEKRQKYLAKAKKRLSNINLKIEALHSAFVAVHKARSIGEMERLLSETLQQTFGINWTRITFTSQSSTDLAPLNHIVFQAPLMIGNDSAGQIHFARPGKNEFTEDEVEALHQIGDAVTLAIDRLSKLDESETLKQQWETTFDSISEPLCLTDNQYRIQRINRAFCQRTGKSFTQLIGKNCFASLFGEKAPQEFAKYGPKFKVHHEHSTSHGLVVFEISCQPLSIRKQESEYSIIIFRDITEQQKMERQVLESTKMAELGTIGSSIAHELNNPIGGMLSFLQLIKMDLAKDHKLFADVDEMERAGIRCKEIIESLLGFSRRQDATEDQLIDLGEVIRQAIKISELQTRSKGISLEVQVPNKEIPIKGQMNLLAQAIRNILRNSSEAIIEKMKNSPGFDGHIKVELSEVNNFYVINVVDNGAGISKKNLSKIFNPLFSTKGPERNSGLGLTVAFKIISEHGGRLEIYSEPGQGTSAIISLQRPDLQD